MLRENEKNIQDVEDRLPYLNSIQDQCLKLRVQLNQGFDGNQETNVLLSMLTKSIREPILLKIEKIRKRYALMLDEEAGRIKIKYGTRKIHQDNTWKIDIAGMQNEITRLNNLYKKGIFPDEKLTPEMFDWNSTASNQYQYTKLKADNLINQHILQIVLDRLEECGLLLNYEIENNKV